jgi:hypothetical protein
MLSDDFKLIEPRLEVRFRVTFREVLTIVKSVAADIAAPTVASAEVIDISPAEVRVPLPEKVPDPVTVMFPEFVVV